MLPIPSLMSWSAPWIRPRRIAAGCYAALFALAVALALLVLADPLCENRVLSDLASPDGKRHAVVFQRDCAVLRTHSVQVSVLPMWRSGKRYGGNAFAAGGSIRAAPGSPGSYPRVTVRWLDARTLELRHDSGARVLGTPPLPDDDTDVRIVADST